jgi:hypothetical protein
MCIPIHVYRVTRYNNLPGRGRELLLNTGEDTFPDYFVFSTCRADTTRTVTFGRVRLTVPPKTVLTGTATLSGWSNTLKT